MLKALRGKESDGQVEKKKFLFIDDRLSRDKKTKPKTALSALIVKGRGLGFFLNDRIRVCHQAWVGKTITKKETGSAKILSWATGPGKHWGSAAKGKNTEVLLLGVIVNHRVEKTEEKNRDSHSRFLGQGRTVRAIWLVCRRDIEGSTGKEARAKQKFLCPNWKGARGVGEMHAKEEFATASGRGPYN